MPFGLDLRQPRGPHCPPGPRAELRRAELPGLFFQRPIKCWPAGRSPAGLKQRVLLARALYRQPRILFLDEGTAHLDIEKDAYGGGCRDITVRRQRWDGTMVVKHIRRCD
jgi:predicted ABC-type transport system involved in lysophospholipase L1 biosynthesis ATPase subunit